MLVNIRVFNILYLLLVCCVSLPSLANGYSLPSLRLKDNLEELKTAELEIRQKCMVLMGTPNLNYTATDVSVHHDTDFTISERTACLAAPLTRQIREAIHSLEKGSLVNTTDSKSLMIQLLVNAGEFDVLSPETENIENQIGSLIAKIWILSTSFKDLQRILPEETNYRLVSNLNRIRSLSLVGALQLNQKFYGFEYPFIIPDTGLDLPQPITREDALNGDFSSEISQELACILNPDSDFCPQKVVFIATNQTDLSKYVLSAKHQLRPELFSYRAPLKSKSSKNSDLCLQLQIFTIESFPKISPHSCGQTDYQKAKALGRFLTDLHNKDLLNEFALKFNSDRLHKIFPWGDARLSKVYALHSYIQDVRMNAERADKQRRRKSIPEDLLKIFAHKLNIENQQIMRELAQ